MIEARRRWRADPRVLVDLVVAAVVAVLAVFEVAPSSAEALPGERTADAVAYALVIVASVSLVWRRRAPIARACRRDSDLTTFWLRGHGALLSVFGLPALYAVAAHAEHRRRAWWALGGACAGLVLVASVSVLDRPDGFDVPASLQRRGLPHRRNRRGVIIRNRERIFVDTERRAAAAEADRLAEAQRAVVRERGRIAREMHDVVAHAHERRGGAGGSRTRDRARQSGQGRRGVRQRSRPSGASR